MNAIVAGNKLGTEAASSEESVEKDSTKEMEVFLNSMSYDELRTIVSYDADVFLVKLAKSILEDRAKKTQRTSTPVHESVQKFLRKKAHPYSDQAHKQRLAQVLTGIVL